MTNDEKYALLLDGCRTIQAIAGRISRMAAASQTFIRGGDVESEGRALDNALRTVAPYVIALNESEFGLEDMEGDASFCDETALRFHKFGRSESGGKEM